MQWSILHVNDITNYIHDKRIRDFFKNNPNIILISCSTGRGDINLAQQLSRLGFSVKAPDNNTNLRSIWIDESNPDKIEVSYIGANVRVY